LADATGTTVVGNWLEYNGEAADNATHRMRQFSIVTSTEGAALNEVQG
jgi:hypothetical protein